MPVFIGGKDVVVFGTATITNTATQLGTSFCYNLYIQNDPGNNANIRIGDASSQVVAIGTGADMSLQISNQGIVWLKSDSGSQRVNWALTK